jgi:5-methyltetrahydrofolate--homocysteine methyltransferase
MDQLKEFVRTGKAKETENRIKALIEKGVESERLLKDALLPAMDEVGDLFQKGEYFIGEMLVAAKAMQQGLEILRPHLTIDGVEPLGKVVIGTVRGDLHDIGKNILGMALEGSGFEVIDIGIDVTSEKFIEAINKHNPIVVGLSALLTTTMTAMEDTIGAIRKEGIDVKIMIGGAPVDQEFADEIGADFYGPDSTAGKNYVKKIADEMYSSIQQSQNAHHKEEY